MPSADPFGFLRPVEESRRVTSVVVDERADRKGEADVERVAAAPGKLVLLVTEPCRLIGEAEHPERLRPVDPGDGQGIVVRLRRDVTVAFRVVGDVDASPWAADSERFPIQK